MSTITAKELRDALTKLEDDAPVYVLDGATPGRKEITNLLVGAKAGEPEQVWLVQEGSPA